MDSGGGRADSRPPTAEEEALKKNTDCVYFLASPLTCKKGNECEYRHSEGARLNPRDCYYWLKSNCLNPKCAFRHPPLDGLIVPPPSGPVLPPTLNIAPKQTPLIHTPAYNLNKQSRSEPCIFFQKGHCLKGEWCPFVHEPAAGGDAVPQQVAKVPPTHPEQVQATKKEPLTIKQCTNQQYIPKVTGDFASGESVPSAKPVIRAEAPLPNGLSQPKNLIHHQLGNKLPKSQPATTTVTNSNTWSRDQNPQNYPSDEQFDNGLEPGEIVGEHFSDFDVATNMNGGGYFHNGGEFGRKLSQGGRKLESHRLPDYRPAPIYERNQFQHSVHELERNGRVKDSYDMKPHKISSEGSLERSLLLERKMPQRHKSPDEVDRADLRHRLRLRKHDGSRSAISPDNRDRRDDRIVKDKYRGQHSRRDHLQAPSESSISARLRGRISLPGTSSSVSVRSLSEKERDVSRHHPRVSPTRPISNQRRRYDGTRRPSEDPPLGGSARSLASRLTKREDVDSLNFTGPKSLAELKGSKMVESSQGQSTKSKSDAILLMQNNVKVEKVASYQERDGSPPFEGPKPLSVLLKRKREDAPMGGVISSSGDEKNQRNEGAEVCNPETAEEVQPTTVLDLNNEESHTVSDFAAPGPETVGEEEDLIPSGDNDDGQSAKGELLEAEDYMEDDAMEDQELQNFDQVDGGEYDYEVTETGDFKTEYERQEGDGLDDEDDDEEDFARKVGLMFS